MDSIGAEVGQKMRSAIKAKLTELECYVDDELPDYIMVMVANKRSKSQMNDDLQLFLTNKTAAFVDWLHIVLKKLKEVTVTNPEIYKKVSKRKVDELDVAVNVKKEKKIKKEKKSKKSETKEIVLQETQERSLTDDLPMNVSKLSDQRRVMVMTENEQNLTSNLNEDNFDIPPLSAVDEPVNEKDLEDIENKIKSVKSRLGMLVDSDSNDEDCINIKAEPDELFADKKEFKKPKQDKQQTSSLQKERSPKETSPEPKTPPPRSPPSPEMQKSDQKKSVHERITFSYDHEKTPPLPKRKSIMDRLGKRQNSTDDETSFTPKKAKASNSERKQEKKSKTSQGKSRREEDKYKSGSLSSRDKRNDESSKSEDRHRRSEKGSVFSRISDPEAHNRSNREKSKESILSRLGVQSKVSIPKKEEDAFKTREVPSVIKIKPRVIPPNTPQANKNLLLKAVAEAQKSIASTPTVGNNIKPNALYTRKYKGQNQEERTTNRKLSDKQKNELRNIIVQINRQERSYSSHSEDEELEYIPKPIKNPPQNVNLNYTPSSKLNTSTESGEENIGNKQHFIVTLDGIDKVGMNAANNSIKSRLDVRKSPIVFDKVNVKTKAKVINIPDKLPVVHASLLLKNKERCKYWPVCRQGDKCEFVHPTSNCEKFPNCKFGDKCLYIHPSCKFSSSCTRRDCPYSHAAPAKTSVNRVTPAVSLPVKSALQTCKFFPNCTNINCPYYHPKPCKFGKFCKNQSECTFIHSFSHSKGHLTWRPK